MKVLDLFSGIGGFSLGLERAGMTTVAFCEIEPFCQHILAKHWPGVPIFDDIRNLRGADLGSIDLICGGFPCQDISVAGKGAGLAGERSGLWREYARLIGEIRPAWVVIENVVALRSRGLDQILGEIATLGYDAEWHCIPAAAIGAPHRRDRVWIVAYATQRGRREHGNERGSDGGTGAGQSANGGETLAYAEHGECEWRNAVETGHGTNSTMSCGGRFLPVIGPVVTSADFRRAVAQCSWGRAQPGMGGENDGLPARMDTSRPVEAWEGNTPRTIGRGSPNRRPRLKALGNSVVPQVVELIGRAVMRQAQS